MSTMRRESASGETSEERIAIPLPWTTLTRNTSKIPSQKKGKRIAPINKRGT